MHYLIAATIDGNNRNYLVSMGDRLEWTDRTDRAHIYDSDIQNPLALQRNVQSLLPQPKRRSLHNQDGTVHIVPYYTKQLKA